MAGGEVDGGDFIKIRFKSGLVSNECQAFLEGVNSTIVMCPDSLRKSLIPRCVLQIRTITGVLIGHLERPRHSFPEPIQPRSFVPCESSFILVQNSFFSAKKQITYL